MRLFQLHFQHERNKTGQLVLTLEHACREICPVIFQSSASKVLNNQTHYKYFISGSPQHSGKCLIISLGFDEWSSYSCVCFEMSVEAMEERTEHE